MLANGDRGSSGRGYCLGSWRSPPGCRKGFGNFREGVAGLERAQGAVDGQMFSTHGYGQDVWDCRPGRVAPQNCLSFRLNLLAMVNSVSRFSTVYFTIS